VHETTTRAGRKNVSGRSRPLAALALVALISAGCSNAPAGTGTGGNTGTGSSGGNATTASRDQAVKFAECMRANGVKNFPDPSASGDFAIDTVANRSGVDTSSAAFTQARSACKDLEPSGFTGKNRTAEQQQAALKFAQCIRDNGVKDFPDPAPDGPLVDTNRIPSAARNGGISILNAAMQKCRDLAANAGVAGDQ